MISGLVIVVIPLSIVLVRIVLIIVPYTKIGESQEAHKSGGTTKGVENSTPYLTAHRLSVTPMEGILAVMIL